MITELAQLPGVIFAEIAGVDGEGRPLVTWDGSAAISAQALSTPGAPAWSDCIGARVLICFVGGNEATPVIIGLLEQPSTTVDVSPTPASETPEVVRIEAGRELVIECGEAKIALRKDGRIEIRGTHLISRSSGPNKVKGASVFIN